VEQQWTYKEFDIRGGLKPEVPHFQYFFVVSQGPQKRWRYCVWIEDDALTHFDPAGNKAVILDSNREAWLEWVKGKLDRGDFRDLVLKFDKEGRSEFDLSALDEKLTLD
jgi:hypothetical protein